MESTWFNLSFQNFQALYPNFLIKIQGSLGQEVLLAAVNRWKRNFKMGGKGVWKLTEWALWSEEKKKTRPMRTICLLAIWRCEAEWLKDLTPWTSSVKPNCLQ